MNDDRPTKTTIKHDGSFGGMFIGQDQDEDGKKEPHRFGEEIRYTVIVGDLCYVAIGQIVNRDYWAVRWHLALIIGLTVMTHFFTISLHLGRSGRGLGPVISRADRLRVR